MGMILTNLDLQTLFYTNPNVNLAAGRFMMRFKIPNGIVTAKQTAYLALIIAKYGADGCADITTRQNYQLRGILLEDVPEIMKGLEEHGLSSIQSGMDNVRNGVGSPIAGIDPHEVG
jgi:ferredoxin-nitrite reductase